LFKFASPTSDSETGQEGLQESSGNYSLIFREFLINSEKNLVVLKRIEKLLDVLTEVSVHIGPLSLVSTTEELLDRKLEAPV
jgi:hypothetical protein